MCGLHGSLRFSLLVPGPSPRLVWLTLIDRKTVPHLGSLRARIANVELATGGRADRRGLLVPLRLVYIQATYTTRLPGLLDFRNRDARRLRPFAFRLRTELLYDKAMNSLVAGILVSRE